MDEPLSNLDAKLRVTMRTSLQQLHARLGTTTVYVTHDQVEAMTLGQRVAVMRDGQMQQVDAPQTLYDEPGERVRRGVHRLAVDEPRRDRLGGDTVCFGGFSVPLDREPRPALRRRAGVRSSASARRRSRTPSSLGRAAAAGGAVEVLEELGSDAFVFFEVDAERSSSRTPCRTSRRTRRRCSRRSDARALRRPGRSADEGPRRRDGAARGRSVAALLLLAGDRRDPAAELQRRTQCPRA